MCARKSTHTAHLRTRQCDCTSLLYFLLRWQWHLQHSKRNILYMTATNCSHLWLKRELLGLQKRILPVTRLHNSAVCPWKRFQNSTFAQFTLSYIPSSSRSILGTLKWCQAKGCRGGVKRWHRFRGRDTKAVAKMRRLIPVSVEPTCHHFVFVHVWTQTLSLQTHSQCVAALKWMCNSPLAAELEHNS